jgi:hypothetical protein
MLWGRAAGRCAEPTCRRQLFEDATETDDPSVIGENCHIVAEKDDGPRPNPAMPLEARNAYSNLILMCRNHHKMIDDQENKYTVERLHDMKDAHEKWVRENLEYDAAKQQDDEKYADMLDTWQRLAHVDDWMAWSSHVLSNGQPSMHTEIDKDLLELRSWLLNRVWPERYIDVENAFHNFRNVLSDLQEQFRRHAEPLWGGEMLWTKKFYKIDEWDPAKHQELLRRFNFHVDVVDDLMLELTRAGNLLCDRVRESFAPSYRLKEGRLVIQTGPNMRFEYKNVVVQYSADERAVARPYPGLVAFLSERSGRDMHFGKGTVPTERDD